MTNKEIAALVVENNELNAIFGIQEKLIRSQETEIKTLNMAMQVLIDMNKLAAVQRMC